MALPSSGASQERISSKVWGASARSMVKRQLGQRVRTRRWETTPRREVERKWGCTRRPFMLWTAPGACGGGEADGHVFAVDGGDGVDAEVDGGVFVGAVDPAAVERAAALGEVHRGAALDVGEHPPADLLGNNADQADHSEVADLDGQVLL